MLDLSQRVLKSGYTIYISKKADNLHGTYLQDSANGLHVYELPQEELEPLTNFNGILTYLNNGALLQVHQRGPQITSVIGMEKTEGPYCETKYLEVQGEKRDFDYVDTLVGLDIELANQQSNNKNDVIQYTKLYKGVDRYE